MRDAVAIANPVVADYGLHPSVVRRSVALASIAELVGSDRRFYSPTLSVAPPAALSPRAVRLVERVPARSPSPRPRSATALLRAPVAFAVPKAVAICVRRHVRREVLMARGVGGSRVRRPRRNPWSDVSCR